MAHVFPEPYSKATQDFQTMFKILIRVYFHVYDVNASVDYNFGIKTLANRNYLFPAI